MSEQQGSNADVTQAQGKSSNLTFKEKMIYATGNIPGGFYGSFAGQIQTFYFAWMGLNIKFIIISQIIYAIWNAVNDPIFGMLQDRTRTKEGRYIPWIKWSAPLFTIAFILLFLPVQKWRYATSGDEYQVVLAAWYLISQMFYDTGFTIIFIAHVALMPQMTMDQQERTDISVLSTITSIIGIASSSAIPLYFLTNPNAEKIMWFQVCVIIVGIGCIIPWILIVRTIKENHEYIPPIEEQLSLWESIKCVFKNPSGRIYVIYDGISVGLLNTIMVAITFVISWVFGVHDQYNAEWTIVDIIPYLLPVVICFIIGLVIEMKLPLPKEQKGFGKDVKFTLWYSMIMEAIGFFIAFLGVYLSSNLEYESLQVPEYLWVVSIGMSIAMLGFSGDFIYHNVMRADTIDYDEVTTGERRESVYAGVGCLLSKPMISVAMILVPAIMTYYGLVAKSPDDITDSALVVNQGFANATLSVAIAGFLVPSILALIGVLTWYWYPLDKDALIDLRAKMEVMHQKKREDRLNNTNKIEQTSSE